MRVGDNMETNKLFSKVFMWMFLGLLTTGLTSYYVVSNPNILTNVMGGSTYLILIILEIGLVIFLSSRIKKMSFMTAWISFILYSLVNGITIASILIVYELSSIILMFGLTALLFLIFGLIGYFTKTDLSKFGNILLMMLIGILITSLVNIFLGNEMIDMIVCAVGVIVFLGIVAYDVQKIKQLTYVIEDNNKLAIIGALELYLDFINIFLYLLQLFGNSKD